jgi:hypothetical protein
MSDNALTRFLGGSPLAVALKLAVLSIIVGAVLHFLGLSPYRLIRGLRRAIEDLLGSGWDAVRTIGDFALYGAMIVVPIWIVMRLVATRR